MLNQASLRVRQTAESRKAHLWWGILLLNTLWWSSRVLTARILLVRQAYARRGKVEVRIMTNRSTFPRAKAESCKTHPNSKIGSIRLTWIRRILHSNILTPLKTCPGYHQSMTTGYRLIRICDTWIRYYIQARTHLHIPFLKRGNQGLRERVPLSAVEAHPKMERASGLKASWWRVS